MTHCNGLVETEVLFLSPQSMPDDWPTTDLWEIAARIPGVAPCLDIDGAEHRRFRARVSGEVFVFLPNKKLVFHGGITAGRGHSGDNLGRDAVEALLRHREPQNRIVPVFGCELACPDSPPLHSFDDSET